MIRYLTILLFLFASGCGGGSSSGSSAVLTPLGDGSFWAVDFTSKTYYIANAVKVGEGNNCYLYLENGQSLSQSTINQIISQFDSAIHPGENTAFGSEPNPGIDGDPKIYILLLNIKDGFTPGTSTSYIAGYFDSMSEYSLSSQNAHSNQKEIIFMNINPAININPAGVEFFATIAHELQHMIHWEQKTHLRSLTDSTWIDEAMAQLARDYCGYGPDYSSVYAYETDVNGGTNHSLIVFDETVGNYGMVYMWGQYMKDRFDSISVGATGNNLFWNMLHNSATGVTEVNEALAAIGSSKNFTSAFRDWALANFFGNGDTFTAPQSEWSYSSINTWPGIYNFNNGQDRVTLPGLFPLSKQNLATIRPLDQWSLDYYSFTSTTAAPSVTWTSGAGTATAASFANDNNGAPSVIFDMISGTSYSFTNVGYLIYENPSSISYSSSQSPVDSIAHTLVNSAVATPVPVGPSEAAVAAKIRTPMEIMKAMNSDPTVRQYVKETGKPLGVYVDSWFREREKELRSGGARPPF